jgi:hypothetical protein
LPLCFPPTFCCFNFILVNSFLFAFLIILASQDGQSNINSKLWRALTCKL